MLFTVGTFAYADSSTFRSRSFYHGNDVMKQNLHRNLRKLFSWLGNHLKGVIDLNIVLK